MRFITRNRLVAGICLYLSLFFFALSFTNRNMPIPPLNNGQGLCADLYESLEPEPSSRTTEQLTPQEKIDISQKYPISYEEVLGAFVFSNVGFFIGFKCFSSISNTKDNVPSHYIGGVLFGILGGILARCIAYNMEASSDQKEQPAKDWMDILKEEKEYLHTLSDEIFAGVVYYLGLSAGAYTLYYCVHVEEYDKDGIVFFIAWAAGICLAPLCVAIAVLYLKAVLMEEGHSMMIWRSTLGISLLYSFPFTMILPVLCLLLYQANGGDAEDLSKKLSGAFVRLYLVITWLGVLGYTIGFVLPILERDNPDKCEGEETPRETLFNALGSLMVAEVVVIFILIARYCQGSSNQSLQALKDSIVWAIGLGLMAVLLVVEWVAYTGELDGPLGVFFRDFYMPALKQAKQKHGFRRTETVDINRPIPVPANLPNLAVQ
ncbi:MAG: hypothetical protein ACPGC9_01130 [Cytophagales bacterium]